jgi:hypothetical protein
MIAAAVFMKNEMLMDRKLPADFPSSKMRISCDIFSPFQLIFSDDHYAI